MGKSIIEREIKTLERTEKGEITPRQLIDSARDKSSPIHDHFEWDDTLASENYRILQAAKYLFLQIKVVRIGEKKIELLLKKTSNTFFWRL